jgi:hypothetical protein
MATTNEDLAQSIQADQLSANALNFFGIAPIIGRRFTD